MEFSLPKVSSALKVAAQNAASGLVEREAFVDLILLAAVAREHLLVIGPPGTAKSAAVRRVASVFEGEYFEYLLGRFTEPSELFGPVDLKRLKEGVVETATAGMLPEADIAFLDEVFLGSTAVLNTLLGILNERRFRRGHTHIHCPLKVCVAASNHLPVDEALAAFADRFLVRYFVEPVPDSQLEQLLALGWQGDHNAPATCMQAEYIEFLANQAHTANMELIQPALADCIRLLRKENIILSDRRIVKSQRLIAAAAVLDGRETPNKSDLWPLIHVIPDHNEQVKAREVLKELLQDSSNNTLNAAAEGASQGPLARAQRLTRQVKDLLAKPKEQITSDAVQALGKEIDTSFSLQTMPAELVTAREQLMAAVVYAQ